MSKNSVEIGLTKEKLIHRGIEHLFARAYRGYRVDDEIEKMRRMIIYHPDVLSNRYDAIDNCDSLNEVFSTAKRAEIDLYSIPFWKEKIEGLTASLKEDGKSREVWYGQADYMISAANMIEGYDWKPLFNAVSVYQNSNNYLRPSYVEISKGFAKSDSASFKEHVENQIFFSKEGRPSYPVRGLMYKLYVEQGFLTKKTARKIRSDGSEDSSVSGLKALVENTELYSNSDELLLQFTDSKYERVIGELVDSLPEYLLASVMGTPFYYAKQKLERRLERIEAERSQANEELSDG